MSARTLREDIKHTVLRINLAAGTHGTRSTFELDYGGSSSSTPGYRLDRDGHHVSPRLPAAQMINWLDGYAQALDDALSNRIPRVKGL